MIQRHFPSKRPGLGFNLDASSAMSLDFQFPLRPLANPSSAPQISAIFASGEDHRAVPGARKAGHREPGTVAKRAKNALLPQCCPQGGFAGNRRQQIFKKVLILKGFMVSAEGLEPSTP